MWKGKNFFSKVVWKSQSLSQKGCENANIVPQKGCKKAKNLSQKGWERAKTLSKIGVKRQKLWASWFIDLSKILCPRRRSVKGSLSCFPHITPRPPARPSRWTGPRCAGRRSAASSAGRWRAGGDPSPSPLSSPWRRTTSPEGRCRESLDINRSPAFLGLYWSVVCPLFGG